MNENLSNQIVAALVQDGTIKMTADEIASAIASAISDLDKQYLFKGVATPDFCAGKVNEPTLYVAVAGGWYAGMGNNQVNEGEIRFLVSDDGAEWVNILAYSAGGGAQVQSLVVEGTFGTDDYYGSVFYPAETPGNPTFEEAKSCFFAGGMVFLKGTDEWRIGDITRLVIAHIPAFEDGDSVYDESLMSGGEYPWYKTYNS